LHGEKYLVRFGLISAIPAIVSFMSKFYQFCFLMLVTAVATVLLLFPYSLQNRLASMLQGKDFAIESIPQQIPLSELKEIANSSPERVWRETGATVMPVAAQIMAVRNVAGVPLDKAQKGYLRPLFGNLVDRVTIVYQAKLLDRWSQGGKETHIGKVNSSAQTYGDRIYLRTAHQPRKIDQLILIAHELTHSQQCQQAGGIGKFGARYFEGYYQGGETYEDNPLEKSARMTEQKFVRQLCKSVSCPPRSGRYYVNYQSWGFDIPVNL
jgi:hypothetical protein